MISELMKRFKSGNFNAKSAVKYMIASFYNRDGNQLIEIYDRSYQSGYLNDKYYRSKLFVNLLMSLECSFKACIIALSDISEEPYNAYLTVRKSSHSLSKLFTELKQRETAKYISPVAFDNQVIDEIDKLSVKIRYTLDVYNLAQADIIYHTSPNSTLSDDNIPLYFEYVDTLFSKTIETKGWIENLRDIACTWNNYAANLIKDHLQSHAIASGQELKDIEREKQLFLSAFNK